MSEEPRTPAHAYQQYYAPSMFEPLSEAVVGHAQPVAGERVLDVACGTGILTRRVAESVQPGGAVVGVDINPGMIDVARELSSDGDPRIEYRQGDATALDLPDAAFDLVTCQQGLQFFPDRAAGTAEMRRVTRDGGRAVIAAWQGLDRHPLFAALADAEEPHLKELGVDMTRDELVAPFSLGADELRDLLESAGFHDVDVAEASIEARFAEPDRFVERMEFAYAAVVPQFAEDPTAFKGYLDAISNAAKDIVARYRSGDFVVFPMHTHIAIGRA